MRLVLILFTVLSIGSGVALTEQASGAAPKAKASKKAGKKPVKKVSLRKSKAPKGDLQTDVRFDDSVLHGQYQVPEEALAKVENEKVLDDLLGVRRHFKDRLQEAAEQE